MYTLLAWVGYVIYGGIKIFFVRDPVLLPFCVTFINFFYLSSVMASVISTLLVPPHPPYCGGEEVLEG